MTQQERQFIVERAQGCCEYCRTRQDYATQNLAIEHVQPRSQGGNDSLDNLALSCPGCNGHKYNKTQAQDPESLEIVALYNPRIQDWTTHFAWSYDYSALIGLTPTGRATIELLQLNRLGIRNIRLGMLARGDHPNLSQAEMIQIKLLNQINQTMLPAQYVRFQELIQKRDSSIIAEVELQELIGITDEIETRDVKRLEALIELSQIRGVSLDELMQNLGLKREFRG